MTYSVPQMILTNIDIMPCNCGKAHGELLGAVACCNCSCTQFKNQKANIVIYLSMNNEMSQELMSNLNILICDPCWNKSF